MRLVLPAAAAGVILFLLFSGGNSAVCSERPVTMEVTSAADVSDLTHSLSCTGPGVFLVTWHENIQISSRIDVSDGKNLTVTGVNASLQGSAYPDATIDAGSTTGIFAVSNGSMLSLRHLTVTGGMSEGGGAVTATAYSIVTAADCVFARNNASSGGKISNTFTPPLTIPALLVGESLHSPRVCVTPAWNIITRPLAQTAHFR